MPKNDYETAKIAVDPVIFTIHEGKLKVLLQMREKEPFKGMLELPGGILLTDETAEETLKRKLSELVGYQSLFFKQFYTFTQPGRDPRERTISISFIALVSEEKINAFEGCYEVEAIKSLAFDHKEIIKLAKEYLKENINSSIVKHFMPKAFPLNKLQDVYEALDKEYDNRNFRKKMISSGIVEETRQMEHNVSHRPARLFRFK